MRRYKKFILHCGIHKTGSSYLQASLASNRDLLAANSILYPEPHDSANEAFGPQHSIAAIGYDHGKSFEQNVGAFFALDSDCETLLMSGEEFSRASTHPSFFQGLLDIGAEVKVVFYLRRFDHLLESVYSQCIKDYLTGPIEVAEYQLDFYEILRSFVEALGPDRVVVRPYNPKFWPGESIGQDFFSAIGLPHLWGAMRKPAGRINESLSRPETYMLSVTEGIAEKQRLMDHFRARPFPDCDRAKFFRSPDFRFDFNLRYIGLNSGVAALNGGVDITEFLDLANVDDDPHWQAFDPNDPQIVDYLETFRAKHSDLDGGDDWEVQ
ncbi:hypothetical protein NKH47_01710 [Mesorhizobium sp. M1060]|uniref:hypothetical protein n=1 Tax=Mesorhizobium sp. M1060 TaxID=2957052 RepID=UPI003339A88B